MKGRTQPDKRFVVYIHENKINNKKYVGITSKKPEERWGKFGSGYSSQPRFYNAIKKYGWEAFEHKIIYRDLILSEALKKEFELSKEFNTTLKEYGYNNAVGTGGNFFVSDETRKKYSERSKGKNNAMYGKKHNSKSLEKMKIAQKRNAKYGKNNHESKAVIGISLKDETKKVFESANQAALFFKLFNNSHIIECCKGKRKSVAGYKWLYLEDFNNFSNEEIQVLLNQNKVKVILSSNNHPNSREVIAFSPLLNEKREFYSVQDGAAFFNIPNTSPIIRVCKRKNFQSHGLLWYYKDSFSEEILKKDLEKYKILFLQKIIGVNKDNEKIISFASIKEARNFLMVKNNDGILKCLKGVRKTYKGYKWFYLEK